FNDESSQDVEGALHLDLVLLDDLRREPEAVLHPPLLAKPRAGPVEQVVGLAVEARRASKRLARDAERHRRRTWGAAGGAGADLRALQAREADVRAGRVWAGARNRPGAGDADGR